jgi:hypothetical protein
VPDPKKPTAIEQMVEILRSLVTEPVTDQSSARPTAEDVKRVKRAMAAPKRRKPAAKKKPAATKRKTVRKTVSRKKPTARTAKRRKTARK